MSINDIVIVGAGWAGIWTAFCAKSKGLQFQVLEAREGVGGVWQYTHYPGCRVDSEVPFYEFSKEELRKEWSWSERFPSRQEIKHYFEWVAKKLQLYDSIVFGAAVASASWHERERIWSVSTKDGREYRGRYFVCCTGYTTIPYAPAIPGVDLLPQSFHSSRLPPLQDFTGKKVGVVGTGASGVQIIEAIAPEVESLVVFQRTPNLAIPMQQRALNAKEVEESKKKPLDDKFSNGFTHTGWSKTTYRNTFDDPPELRESFYTDLWNEGGLGFWLENYDDLLTSKPANDEAYRFWRSRVQERVQVPTVAEKLAPEVAPHPFGAKRPSLEATYFEAFNRPNVTLVDVNKEPITSATKDGLSTSASSYDLDIVIFATGFDAVVGAMLDMNIRGRYGLPLGVRWDTSPNGPGIRTSYGLMSAGFPNMFFPLGPQSPLAFGFSPQLAEIQTEWLVDAIMYMKRRRLTRMETSEEAEVWWTSKVSKMLQGTLIGQSSSWYVSGNMHGRKFQALCCFDGLDRYADDLALQAKYDYYNFQFNY